MKVTGTFLEILYQQISLKQILKELTKDETNDVSSRLCGSSSGRQTTRTFLVPGSVLGRSWFLEASCLSVDLMKNRTVG